MCYLQLVWMFATEGSFAATDTSSSRVSWICVGSFSNIRALNDEFCIEHSGFYVSLYLNEMYVFMLHALLLYEEVF
jgi:hypothetical protein